MPEKIIGVLGGMGPEATAELYLRIIKATPVEKDQDHYRIIIYSNSKVPDRTAAIFGTGADPFPELIKSGKLLQDAGADFIIIPCNTAHHYLPRLAEELEIPVLHMIKLTAGRVREEHHEVRRAGLLATDGTIRSGLYHQAFEEVGVEILAPTMEDQRRVMKAIYDHIKTGDLEEGGRILHEEAQKLIDAGAEMVLCGCTEVSIVLRDGDLTVPVVDPLQVLAEEAVKHAKG